MTNLEKRAAAYVKTAFGGREIYVNPEGHEPGLYHFTESNHGSYYSKVAYVVTADEAFRSGIGHYPTIIDVTGDSDRILKQFD